MEYLRIFLDSLGNHPKSTIIFLVAIFNIGWIFHIVFIKKNYTKKIYKGYFFYAFFTLLWLISNAYFQSSLLILLDENAAKVMALAANITLGFSAVGFYYISCLFKSPQQKVSKLSWAFLFFNVVYILTLNFIPNATIEGVEIMGDGNFQLIFGKWNEIFFFLGVIIIILGMVNFLLSLKVKRGKIENIKFLYILFGMNLMFGSVIIFDIIFPTFFSNYNYVWIPPILSILDVLIVGYSILVKRFPSLKLIFSNTIKAFFALLMAGIGSYSLYFILKFAFKDPEVFVYIHLLSFINFLVIYNKSYAILNSHIANDLFGITNVEYFRKIIVEFQGKNIVYNTLQQFENDLKELFENKLKIDSVKIILLNKKTQKSYPELIEYCKNNHKILVTKEFQFLETLEKKAIPFIKELQTLGQICLPLYHPSKSLVGLFILGKKTFDSIYTKEEIETLEHSGSHLSLKLIEIIYNSELQKEVEIKTKNLQEQNKKVQEQNKKILIQNEEISHLLTEKTKLLAQQSDFLAITAHELRTPLSIAMLQTDDILLSPLSENSEVKENVGGIKKSLIRLKTLMDKLFDVLQYDLNKINVSPEKTNIFEFIERISEDFEPLTKEKKLSFSLKNKLKRTLIADIDPVYMRQLMQNLLINAIKFTPNGGKIEIIAKEDRKSFFFTVADTGEGVPQKTKKAIFEKFKSNHTMQSPGMGLGLYICKKITALHHGKIWVEKNGAGGASFFVQLPKSP